MFCSFGMLLGQRTAGPQEAVDEPVEFRDVRSSGNVSEAVAIINIIRGGINAETKEPAGKRVFTESDYQVLTSKDSVYCRQKYTDAIILYQEILKDRKDQAVKDRILEAEALRAKQQKEIEQLKRDATLRAKAEFEASKGNQTRMVHLTGALMSDESSSSKWTSKALDMSDQHSSFLQIGKYNTLGVVLKKAHDFTLDGIAIPANTRLVVYKEQNCSGGSRYLPGLQLSIILFTWISDVDMTM